MKTERPATVASAAFAGLMMGLLALLFTAAAPAGQMAAARADAPVAPLLLRQATTLFAQFGYDPAYTRNVPSFDAQDRAYIRSRTADLHRTSFVHVLGEGAWERRGLLAALRAAYPRFRSTYNGAGWSYDRISFDAQGRAYTVLTVELADGTLHNALLASLDKCVSWQVAELPAGDVSGEFLVGHNSMDGPPFLGIYQRRAFHAGDQANYFNFFVLQPSWSGDRLVVPAPILVSRNCFGFSQHSGGASFAVTQHSAAVGRSLTHFVWGEVTTDKKAPGSPIYAASYDPVQGTVGGAVLLGYSSAKNDVHCTSGICADGNGYLHVVFGAHHTPFRHTMSLAPGSTWSGWSVPVDVLSTGFIDAKTDADGNGRQTYLSLVCGPDNALHIAFRQYRKGVDPYFNGVAYMALAYQRRPATPPGQVPATTDWEQPRVLVVPAATKYAIYYQKLAIDHGGRLFLSSSSFTGADAARQRALVRIWRLRGRVGPRPGYYLHRSVLMSDDGGANWRLATSADFTAGLDLPPGDTGVRSPHDGRAVSTGDGSWLWLLRTPQGNALGGVDFRDARNGLAVGDAGTILRTTDGGKTWTPRRTGVTSTFFAVEAVSKKAAYAVGDLGVVLTSADGGKTWKQRQAPSTAPLFGCAFVTDRLGWVVGDGVIYRTGDGGRHWKSQHLPGGETLYAVTAFDKYRLWAVGDKGVIFSTIDGGRHWDLRRPLGGTDPDETRSPGSAASPGGSDALRSGALRVADRLGGADRGDRAERFVALYGVDFADEKRGWAVGEDGELLMSKNGGKTWTPQKSKVAADLSAVRFATAKLGWASGAGGVLLRTTDGGVHWKALKKAPVDMYAVAALPKGKTAWFAGAAGMIMDVKSPATAPHRETNGPTNDLYGAAFTDALHGVAVGAGGAVLATADGGTVWTWRKPSTGTLRAVDLAGATGVAVGDGGAALRSGDAGATWAPSGTGTGQALLAADLADAQNGWAVGAAGTVLRTADGGATWAQQTSGATQDLTSVAAVSPTEAWAGGGEPNGDEEGFVLHTVDGGATWQRQALPLTGQVTALCFVSPQAGYAAGFDFGTDDDDATGFVARTLDGGATWLPVSMPSVGRLRAVTADTAGAVWAAGDRGALVRSTDWGASWMQLAAGCGQHLNGVRFIGATGYAVGAGAAILKTTTGGVPPVR